MTAQFIGYGGMQLGVLPQDACVAAIGALASDAGDGDVTISSPFVAGTVGRDYYYNNLTINSTYDSRAWRVYCRKLTIGASGVLHWDGLAASGATGGALFTTGSLGPNIIGVNGGTGVGAAGTAAGAVVMPGTGVLDGTIFKGGAGGASGSGTINAGGAGGTITRISSGREPRANPIGAAALSASTLATITPGSGGGAGGGDGTNAGGGSGSSAGLGFIMAGEIIVIAGGIIRAKGGAGGNGVAGGAGGGGGGPGGPLFITCGRYTGALPDVSGGAGGNAAGAGVAGSVGKPGYVFFNTFKP